MLGVIIGAELLEVQRHLDAERVLHGPLRRLLERLVGVQEVAREGPQSAGWLLRALAEDHMQAGGVDRQRDDVHRDPFLGGAADPGRPGSDAVAPHSSLALTPRRPLAYSPRMERFAMGLAVLAAVALSVRAADAVPTPNIAGPITSPGSAFVAGTTFDLTPLDYVQEEFFVSGTASAFTSAAPLGSDGRWTATPGETAAYTTRVLAHRPVSRRRFNGTVIVEWLNVTGGVDAAPDWIFTHSDLMREGYAWVGVSAQFVGVAGTGGLLGLNLSLKAVDPVRYGRSYIRATASRTTCSRRWRRRSGRRPARRSTTSS